MKKRVFFIKNNIKKNEIMLKYYSHNKPDNFIDIVFKINNITDENEKINYINIYKENELYFDNLLNENNLLKYFEPSVTYTLLENKIFYLDFQENIYYLNKESEKIDKLTKKDIIKNYFKGYSKNDLIVILPEQLQINEYNLKDFFKSNNDFIKENYPDISTFNKMFNIHFEQKNKIIDCLAKIIDDTNDLKKNDIVYIFDKCPKNYRDKFKVINEHGDIKYVSKNNLNIFDESLQNENIKNDFKEKRKNKIINEEKNGHPTLIKIVSICKNTITVHSFADELNNILIIPHKIIPEFISLNNISLDSNHFFNEIFWVNIPIWFYNKHLK